MAATIAYVAWGIIVAPRGHLFDRRNLYLGPVLTGAAFAFWTSEFYERFQYFFYSRGIFDMLIALGSVAAAFAAILVWPIVFALQAGVWLTYANHPSTTLETVWLAGGSNILGLLAYVLYVAIIDGSFYR